MISRSRLARLLLACSVLRAWQGVVISTRSDFQVLIADNDVVNAGIGVATLIHLVCLFQVVRKPEIPRWSTLISAALLATLSWVEFALGGEGHGKFLPGACLTVFAGCAWKWRDDPQLAERRAIEICFGIAAAMYFNAALSKIAMSGVAWFTPGNISFLVLERSYLTTGALSAFQQWVGNQPVLGAALGIFAVLCELGGALLLFPRSRRFMVVALTCMHIGIGVLMGYLYADWMLCLWGLLLWCPSATAKPRPDDEPTAN